MSSSPNNHPKTGKPNSTIVAKKDPPSPMDPTAYVIKIVLIVGCFLLIWNFQTLFDIELSRRVRGLLGAIMGVLIWKGSGTANALVIRETVESFAVALILAFLFRAFVAEAFVIPTGSMAPTLMGAHKDVRCPECGCDYQCGASDEFDKLGKKNRNLVVTTVCPLCRYEQPLDFKKNANHATFSGDRIIVSKFAYLTREPDRWDVIVFKYPEEARLNYIKRLVGRPKESLTVRHGDILVANEESQGKQVLARKTDSALGAMLQPIFDSEYRPKSLINAGLPSPFQPFPAASTADSSSWKVQYSVANWSAECDATKGSSDQIQWLRYFHRVIDPMTWDYVRENGKFPSELEPYSVRLITDFTHYNAGLLNMNLAAVYNPDGSFAKSYRGGVDPRELPGMSFPGGESSANSQNDGLNWVGDLASEYSVQIDSGNGSIHLDLVKTGIHYRCRIDTSTGVATLQVLKDGNPQTAFDGATPGSLLEQVQAPTSIRGPGKYRIRLSNLDDELRLWINGKAISFPSPTRYASDLYLNPQDRVPHWTPEDPLDGAPVSIGVTNLKVRIDRARVWRDIYYIATTGGNFQDYGNLNISLNASVPESAMAAYLSTGPSTRTAFLHRSSEDRTAIRRDVFMTTPELWKSAKLFEDRKQVEFTLEEDQYFPMGDNSPRSSDARAWGLKYVPERLLIGRAVLVFWPHYWNRPIPFLPNVQRMGLIR